MYRHQSTKATLEFRPRLYFPRVSPSHAPLGQGIQAQAVILPRSFTAHFTTFLAGSRGEDAWPMPSNPSLITSRCYGDRKNNWMINWRYVKELIIDFVLCSFEQIKHRQLKLWQQHLRHKVHLNNNTDNYDEDDDHYHHSHFCHTGFIVVVCCCCCCCCCYCCCCCCYIDVFLWFVECVKFPQTTKLCKCINNQCFTQDYCPITKTWAICFWQCT